MLTEKLNFLSSIIISALYYIYIPFLTVYVFYLKLFSPFDIAKIKELGILHTGILIVGRMISVLLGTASVFLVYLIAQNCLRTKTSLISSLCSH